MVKTSKKNVGMPEHLLRHRCLQQAMHEVYSGVPFVGIGIATTNSEISCQ